jgi:hypothetical protein
VFVVAVFPAVGDGKRIGVSMPLKLIAFLNPRSLPAAKEPLLAIQVRQLLAGQRPRRNVLTVALDPAGGAIAPSWVIWYDWAIAISAAC